MAVLNQSPAGAIALAVPGGSRLAAWLDRQGYLVYEVASAAELFVRREQVACVVLAQGFSEGFEDVREALPSTPVILLAGDPAPATIALSKGRESNLSVIWGRDVPGREILTALRAFEVPRVTAASPSATNLPVRRLPSRAEPPAELLLPEVALPPAPVAKASRKGFLGSLARGKAERTEVRPSRPVAAKVSPEPEDPPEPEIELEAERVPRETTPRPLKAPKVRKPLTLGRPKAKVKTAEDPGPEIVPQVLGDGDPKGEVWALTSTDGGVGKTLLAFELAANAAARGGRVALLDLSLAQPSLSFLCQKAGDNGLGLDGLSPGDIDPTSLGRLLLKVDVAHKVQADLYRSRSTGREDDALAQVDADVVRAFVEAARSLYDLVVVDTLSLYHLAPIWAALEHATGVMLLTTPSVPQVRHTALAAEDLSRSLGDRVEVVVTRAPKGVSTDDLSAALHVAPKGVIFEDAKRYFGIEAQGLADVRERSPEAGLFYALWPEPLVRGHRRSAKRKP